MLHVEGVSSFSLLCSVPPYKHGTVHFIHSSVQGHLDYFQFLTIIDNVAVNILAGLLVLIFTPFFEFILKKRIAESQGMCMFDFRKYCQTLFQSVV